MAREMSERSFDDLARGLAEGSISRRRALGLFASSAIAALLPSTRALADDDHDGYTVCHVPGRPPNCECSRARTIRGLSRRERNRHLRNHPCDTRGNCRNNPYCGTTTTTSSTTSTTTPPGCPPNCSPCSCGPVGTLNPSTCTCECSPIFARLCAGNSNPAIQGCCPDASGESCVPLGTVCSPF